MNKEFIRKIAANVGGVIALANLLGLSRGAVSLWDRVPAERVLEVERLTGVSRYQIRPDVYGSEQ